MWAVRHLYICVGLVFDAMELAEWGFRGQNRGRLRWGNSAEPSFGRTEHVEEAGTGQKTETTAAKRTGGL